MKRIMLVLAPLALSLLMPAQPAAAAPQARVTQLTTEPLPEYPGKEVEMIVKVGDKVLTSKYSGTEVKVDGEECTIVRQSDILAVVE